MSSRLTGANLGKAYLQGANLFQSYLDNVNLGGAHLEGCILRSSFLDAGTNLHGVTFGDVDSSAAFLADVRWNDTNLAIVDWTVAVKRPLHHVVAIELGDEREARTPNASDGKRKPIPMRLQQYQRAVRANRQLAVALRQQGINEDADNFAYRAHRLQRQVLRWQGHWGRAFGSWLLDVISGYGYHPRRSMVTYAFVVLGFATAYFFVAAQVGVTMPPLAALVFSVTSFHGRGFTPGENVLLTNPLTVLAAAEAIVGLFIEITFIATFTQRFFAR